MLQRDFIPRESLRFTANRLQSKEDVYGCVAIQSSAYIAAYKAIDDATQGKITAFVRETDFMQRKVSYYESFANIGRGARVARPLGFYALTTVLGVCTLMQDSRDPTLVHVDGIFVNPDRSGQGVGSALLTSALTDFPEWQTVRAETTYGTRAVRFFEKEGFVDTGMQAPWPRQPYDWGEILLLQTVMEATREQYFDAVSGH
jgi:GNAT superfamily N-acetyltransferase